MAPGQPEGVMVFADSGYAAQTLFTSAIAAAMPPPHASEAKKKAFCGELRRLTDQLLKIGNEQAQKSLADSLRWDIGARLKNRAGTRVFLGAALECSALLSESLSLRAPDSKGRLRGLSVSYERMGDLDRTEDAGRAREWYRKALEIKERLVQADPRNLDYQRGLSISLNRVCETSVVSEPSSAQEWIARAIQINERLLQVDPIRLNYQFDFIENQLTLARLLSATEGPAGGYPALRASCEKAIAYAARTGAKDGFARFLALLMSLDRNPSASADHLRECGAALLLLPEF